MKVRIGTNRLSLIFDDIVIKIPYRPRGLLANRKEYENAIDKPYVAKTYRFGFLNIQEKLTDTVILPYETTDDEVPDVFKELWKNKLNNRFQVGLSKDKQYKYFDYEDVKYKG